LQSKGGLRLDIRSGLMHGGARGAVLAAGEPDKSLLIQAIRYAGPLKMPPGGPLSPSDIEILTTWVKRGAIWPDVDTTASPRESAPKSLTSQSALSVPKHWSFIPVRKPSVPQTHNHSWAASPIDSFILARLEAKGLSPAAATGRQALIRRATFDLLGLPPTPEEVDAFIADRSPQAWAKVVDRLLASPRYGERWGRHWLDIARYADSLDARGIGGEGDISEAWRYRDWVIGAFNRDLPYNQFIMNQIAGDLLPAPPVSGVRTAGETSVKDINVSGTIATGLLAIGNWGNGDADKDKILTDIADDQVDIVSRGFMGLTVGCARCHDHKFDPISTKDYYGLAGIFFSTHILPKLTPKGAGETPLRVPLETNADRDRRVQYAADLAKQEKETSSYRSAQLGADARSMLPHTSQYLIAAWEASHGSQVAVSHKTLRPYALRQWQDYLSLNDYRLMTTSFDRPTGVDGVYGYRGVADTPNVTANTNNEAKMILTFTLPPRSISVHPGPTNGVAVAWKSPISGSVQVSGRVVDADPACGNGIEWAMDRRTIAGTETIASGAFENGALQDFAQGKGGGSLKSLPVKEGDSVELLVLPKGEYSCDTTVVELTVREVGGPRIWNLAGDILTDLHKAGTHPDKYGHSDVWRFYDMADSKRGANSSPDPRLAAWRKAMLAIDAMPTGSPSQHEQLERAASEFQAGFTV